MSPTDRIRQLLSHKPGLKAQQIADELGLDRAEVVTTLHALLGDDAGPGSGLPLVAENPRAARIERRRTCALPARRTLSWPASAATTWRSCRAKAGPASAFRPSDAAGYVVLNELPFARPAGQAVGDRSRRQEARAKGAPGARPAHALSRLSDPPAIRHRAQHRGVARSSRCCSTRSRKRRRIPPRRCVRRAASRCSIWRC